MPDIDPTDPETPAPAPSPSPSEPKEDGEDLTADDANEPEGDEDDEGLDAA
ncbi:hypothetical protein [Phaeospirillum tilakii]|uniref:Uncharacterized protein n=1 Tax=Phaeospirillum tilakii TaxID=741673 RepID=A0ABW5C9Q7_9PROT